MKTMRCELNTKWKEILAGRATVTQLLTETTQRDK
jgi:hypothetical protein